MKKTTYTLTTIGFLICLFGAVWSKEPIKCFVSGCYLFAVGKYFCGSYSKDENTYIRNDIEELNFLNMPKGKK